MYLYDLKNLDKAEQFYIKGLKYLPRNH